MSGKNVNANLTKTSSRSHLLSGAFLCLTVLIQLPFWGAGQAIARDRDTAYRTEKLSAPWSVDSPVAPSRQSRPGVHEAQLNQQEADRYRRIFELQDATDWRAADKLIAEVTDMRLMGHVEYQRLMHPSHKATYSELRGWLERYADHAGADKVYQLALKRMARGDRKPPAPSRDGNAVPTGPNGAYDSVRGLAAAATVSAPRGRSVRTQAATKVELASTDDESSSILPPSAVTIPTSAAIAVAPAPRREPEPPSPDAQRQLERRHRRLESRPERQGRQGVPGAGADRIRPPPGIRRPAPIGPPARTSAPAVPARRRSGWNWPPSTPAPSTA